MKFVDQEIKLTVENVDPPTSLESRHGKLLPNTCRALVVGPSGCGKTNLIYALLTNINGIRFHNVYIYSKTLDQPKYKMLCEILKDVDGVQLFTFHENDEVIPPEKALPDSVFVFDDVLCENQNIVRSYYTRCRHNNIDVFYLAQSFARIPKQLIRDNSNMIILFKQDETNLKHVYMEHCSGDMNYSEFKEFCTLCWSKGRFNFVVISKDCERDNGRYRHGFDTFVVI